MHWARPMLRLVADPATSSRAPRARRRPLRAGARRPRVVLVDRTARIGIRDRSLRAPGPSTDDPCERRRELVELGRLAIAHAMHEALAR
jgi:hypothetical protein